VIYLNYDILPNGITDTGINIVIFHSGARTVIYQAVGLFLLAVIFGALSTILIGIPFYVLVWLYSMYDAYKSAEE